MKIVTAVIETPKGQGLKYDFDPKSGYYQLTKILPMGLVFPFDFGFIGGTVGEDDSNAKPFPEKYYLTIRRELTDRFGGVSVYTHAPVSGIWDDRQGKKEEDRLLVYEVMVDRMEVDFWTNYKKKLAKTFKQDELLIRQMAMGML